MQTKFTASQDRELLERYESLPISYLLRYSILKGIESGAEVLGEIQGREQVKQDVLRALLSGAQPYLVSEEGTGKTRLARSVSKLLGPVPKIKGCPYNDDPKWPKDRMCPRCRASADPVRDFGIEWISGPERFSRIQGNEYTNEAKLLGLKDIQAIAKGMSPNDPLAFAGTGVFRANRGVLFVDELPAIRTKVQVLLHPIIEEKKAILEEYNWEYPLDLLVVSTGNPEGFSHVNEVPRPLLDRLETIYMDLPDENVEFMIMMMERFGGKDGGGREEEFPADFPKIADVKRKVLAPWWILSLINKSVRQSRTCRWLDKKASIRGTTRAIDHTYSSTEIERRRVTRLGDVGAGLKLALRGRVQLRQDLVDFENPRETIRKIDELSEDLVRNALFDLGNDIAVTWDREPIEKEVQAMIGGPSEGWPEFVRDSAILRERLQEIENMGREKLRLEKLVADEDDVLLEAEKNPEVQEEYLMSAAEFILNVCIRKNWLYPQDLSDAAEVYIPREISWAQKGTWR
ncbi:MAG: Magnesium-chelatase 38 kDa subunit [Syntrophorhabdaceae bacterium PtaU1.Bin034]|nr:MAG: Magnesium-chelatase 38 kDa subunit [Syntrophorhabdaceae bacterium PtaU1.Bin034]